MNRSHTTLLRGALKVVSVLTGSALTVMSLSPAEWSRNVLTWTELAWRPAALATGAALLASAAYRFRQSGPNSLIYLQPDQCDGIPDVHPRGIQARAIGALRTTDSQVPQQRHVVRLVLLTGGSTMHYLDSVVRNSAIRSSWDVRVLLVSPDSPEIGFLDEGAKEEIVATCRLLDALQRRAEEREPRVTITYRGMMRLPDVRGWLIDEKHLFFGYFTYVDTDGRRTLREQNTSLWYASPKSRAARDTIEWFASWFDQRWSESVEAAREPAA